MTSKQMKFDAAAQADFKRGVEKIAHAVAVTMGPTGRNVAIQKLKLKEELIKKLPGTDCGVCGAPDCKTLADDVVRGEARLEDCIYMCKEYPQSNGEKK